MGSPVGTLLWAWIILDSGLCSVSLPDIADREFIEECVSEHNRARSAVSPPATNMQQMTWDEDLAATARSWAGRCVFEHNPNPAHPALSSVGENIWAGYPPSNFDAARAIKSWVDEERHYDYNSNSCAGVCGHYTQVVWASSYKVGCAAQLCPGGVRSTSFASQEGVVFVCNYAPAGNVIGRQPYEAGAAACSGCEEACVDSLCRFNYVIIPVVRPIALIFTFIAAYAVRRFYPDVFCYE